MRNRRNVWDIENNPADMALDWYAKAIDVMKGRPITAHNSWRYQAAIHQYIRARDPLAINGEALPPPSEQETYWSRCQHNSWFFLSWHRMYLHIFEEIVAAEVAALGGPADWALPYWNYSRSQGEQRLPPSFRTPMNAAGEANPLYVADRSSQANNGEPAGPRSTDISWALTLTDYSVPWNSPAQAFCGTETGFHHSGGSPKGVDLVPHGTMHGFVGGQLGWMSRFNTAALDPIFWVHHANIDRLWEVWLKRKAAHTNPSKALWRVGVTFHFRGVDGAAVQYTSSEVEDTTALGFDYDDVTDPLPAGMGAVQSVGMTKLDLIGATHQRVKIGVGSKGTSVPTVKVAGANAESLGGNDEPTQVHMRLENITAQDCAPAFDVYLGLTEGADHTAHEHHFVGRISMFGLVESSDTTGPNAGSGLSYDLDVTAVVTALRVQPGWDASKLDVLFVPVNEEKDVEVHVGRISLFAG